MCQERDETDVGQSGGPRILIGGVVVVVLLVVLAGVFAYVVETSGEGASKPMSKEQIMQAERAMAGLPSLEESAAELDRRVEGVARVVSNVVPSLVFTWKVDNNPAVETPCDDDTRGRRASSRFRDARGAIPDDSWPSVYAAVRQYLGIVDDAASQVMQSRPGLHDANFRTPDGHTIKLRTQMNTVVNGSTPCSLPQSVKTSVLQGQ